MWLTRYRQNPGEAKRAIAHPGLVFVPPPRSEENEHRLKTSSGVGFNPLAGGEPLVLWVRKEKDNAFQRGITVGRTSNNDLVIDDVSVSRFHAYFAHDDAAGQWQLVDAGSKNGTWVKGEKLEAKKPVILGQEAVVRFGDVEVTFYMPNAFLRLLDTKAKRPSRR